MASPSAEHSLDLLAIVGATEAEVPVLAELHRNRRVHIVGVYDPRADAVGHELAEILGLRHGQDRAFLEEIASSPLVVLPRERHRFSEAIELLRQRGCQFLNHEEALTRYSVPRQMERRPSPTLQPQIENRLAQLEETVRWMERALDREELLRSLLSIAVQAANADKGSIQLLDSFSRQLFIAYADGLSDHTIRASRQKLGEGIAGGVAKDRVARLLHGRDPVSTAAHRDRPDILSAISAPLLWGKDVLGVLNVSTDVDSRRLTPADLAAVERLATRIAPVLHRLLEIQAVLDRVLVEDLHREFGRLMQMAVPTEEAIALLRDLVQDVSGAQALSLIVLPTDGPAYLLHPKRDSEGRPVSSRDVDPSQGILGQVLLGRTPVLMEERNRRAGERLVRRDITLYVPLGPREAFAVLIFEFQGLSALSHFQRNLERVCDLVTPRLAEILSRHESEGRNLRLRRLAEGLSHLASLSLELRTRAAAQLFRDLTRARTVAMWRSTQPEPEVVLGSEDGHGAVWTELRQRLHRSPAGRLREMDPSGSGLRSLLLVGLSEGPALAAINREPEDPLAEMGFREEDLESATLLLESVHRTEVVAPEEYASLPSRTGPDQYAVAGRLLDEVLSRELSRAQRYHFGFSLSCFELGVAAGRWARIERALRARVDEGTRATDCVLWLSPTRLAVVAPEESRGQRHLVRRFEALLQAVVADLLPEEPSTIRSCTVAYPRDGDRPDELVARCFEDLERPTD